MSDNVTLPLPRQQTVILTDGRKIQRRTSVPLDRLYVTDEHAGQIISGIKACAESNSARPVLIQMARILLGDEALEQEGLL